MKSLRKGLVEIIIEKLNNSEFYWLIDNTEDFGIANMYMDDVLPTRRKAINNWKKFAKLNGIKNYKIVEG